MGALTLARRQTARARYANFEGVNENFPLWNTSHFFHDCMPFFWPCPFTDMFKYFYTVDHEVEFMMLTFFLGPEKTRFCLLFLNRRVSVNVLKKLLILLNRFFKT